MSVDHKTLAIFAIFSSLFLQGCSDTSDDGTSEKKFSGDMVLAMSWQPGFCETRPRLPECRTQNSDRFDADHFSLHGLWPQPGSAVFCGVSDADRNFDKRRRWKKLPGLGLSDGLKKQLWKIMPGARSYLHRHEWIKHGTCYSKSPEIYYADSLQLMEQVNASSVRDLFSNNIGKPLTNRTIRRAFDQAFGDGVGDRVRVACKRDGSRTIITEVTLGLSGEIAKSANIKLLALASPKTKSGCPRGVVDPVGFQ